MSILTVGEMMSRDPVSVPPECPLRDAAKVMRDMRIRSVLIKDGGEYVGIITGTDMAKRILEEEPYDGVTAGEVMSAPLYTIREDEPLQRANEEMVRRHVRHLVVVDAATRPVGIISARDLLVPEEDVPGAIPWIGDDLAYFIKGGDTVGQLALTRFFAFHVVIMPLCMMVLLGLHFLMIRRLGIAGPL